MIQRPEPAEKNDGGVHTSSRPKEKHCAERRRTRCARRVGLSVHNWFSFPVLLIV